MVSVHSPLLPPSSASGTNKKGYKIAKAATKRPLIVDKNSLTLALATAIER